MPTSDEALKYIREICTPGNHSVGTCKMGIDPMAVVDPELRVHGVEGIACRRCLHHANSDRGSYERARHHDWRESSRSD